MLDHIGLAVGDFARSKAFYAKALAPLGYTVMMEFTAAQAGGQPAAGLGGTRPDFWIAGGGPITPHTHIAFAVKNRALVDAFYKAALAAGGRDNGAPGIRAHYHPNYYAAFVLDPDGHNVEAVCHAPVARAKRRPATKAKAAAKTATKKPAGRKPAGKKKAKRRQK
ncbi:MAG: VOC family protein [Rhodospirillaceae bacterium]|nr:VOC family protein [Rhodospirillaceae bacterium]